MRKVGKAAWLPLLVTAAFIPGSLAAQAGSTTAVAHPELWPAAKSPVSLTDAATERRIDRMIAVMSVEQKVGQLVQADISTITPKDLETYPLGSILAGGNSGPYGNERGTAADWHRLVEEFRATSVKAGTAGAGIPILFGVDAVHGHSNVPGATIFPHNIGLGAAHDPDLIRRIGAVTAAEVAGSGIEWTFAPTLAVPQDLRWGRSYEGYSSDPKLVASYAHAMTIGLQGALVAGKPLGPSHVAATAKHFLADGGTDLGKDQGDATVAEQAMIDIHSQGYPPAIDAGSLTVMASFSSWNGVKNHGNESLLTGVLKQRMGFNGLVVGDWNGHGQIPGCTVTDCKQALLAGLDLYMAPDSWKGLYESLLRDAKAGEIPTARLDDAVRRILRVKAKLGLLGKVPVKRFDPKQIGAPAHLAVAREAVAKSLVLLKNEDSVLPLRPGSKVLVVGSGADNMAMQAGGWTVSWQGTDVVNGDFPNGQTIYAALTKAVTEAGGRAILSADGSHAAKPDVAIVVFGEKPYAEFLGDVPTLDYQPEGATDLALLKKLKGQGIKVVSVFLSGRPMFASPEINASDAFVAAWLPGTQGAGVADVLVAGRSGKTARDFTGRLPFAWPADARSPIDKPLFERGYGLSYGKPGKVAPLSEDPGIDVAATVDTNRLFAAGRAAGPWSLTLADAAGGTIVSSASATSLGGKLSMKPVDVSAQEDGRLFSWSGTASVVINGAPADFTRQLNNAFALRFDLVPAAVGTGAMNVSFGTATFNVANLLRRLPTDKLATIKIPLRCFADAGAKVAAVDTPLKLEGSDGYRMAIRTVTIEAVGEPLDCPAN